MSRRSTPRHRHQHEAFAPDHADTWPGTEPFGGPPLRDDCRVVVFLGCSVFYCYEGEICQHMWPFSWRRCFFSLVPNSAKCLGIKPKNAFNCNSAGRKKMEDGQGPVYPQPTLYVGHRKCCYRVYRAGLPPRLSTMGSIQTDETVVQTSPQMCDYVEIVSTRYLGAGSGVGREGLDCKSIGLQIDWVANRLDCKSLRCTRYKVSACRNACCVQHHKITYFCKICQYPAVRFVTTGILFTKLELKP